MVDFDPAQGAEMTKRRPAVVVSSAAVGLLPLRIVVPITFSPNPCLLLHKNPAMLARRIQEALESVTPDPPSWRVVT
jgi:hypothetical protein